MQEIIANLRAVANVLNTVTVCGRQNCLNLAGSIEIIDGIAARLA